MKLRTSHLFLIALVGGGAGAWYGVRSAKRGDVALTQMIWAAQGRAANAAFCYAPPERALAKIEARVRELEGDPGRERNPEVARYPRVELAMLNERLGKREAASAQWAEVLKGCDGERCKREHWREQVQQRCKP